MSIQENTFAEACFNQNSVAELQTALSLPADTADMKTWELSEAEYFEQLKIALDAKMTDAEKAAKEVGLQEMRNNYTFWQSFKDNGELIDELQDSCVAVFSGDDEDDLFVFSDGSCINRQGDEYFLNDDADMLDSDYLKSVGYE
jgi:hypothetical protein